MEMAGAGGRAAAMERGSRGGRGGGGRRRGGVLEAVERKAGEEGAGLGERVEEGPQGSGGAGRWPSGVRGLGAEAWRAGAVDGGGRGAVAGLKIRQPDGVVERAIQFSLAVFRLEVRKKKETAQ